MPRVTYAPQVTADADVFFPTLEREGRREPVGWEATGRKAHGVSQTLAAVKDVATSPLVGGVLRAGQALKGAYDASRTADIAAERLAQKKALGGLELGPDEPVAPQARQTPVAAVPAAPTARVPPNAAVPDAGAMPAVALDPERGEPIVRMYDRGKSELDASNKSARDAANDAIIDKQRMGTDPMFAAIAANRLAAKRGTDFAGRLGVQPPGEVLPAEPSSPEHPSGLPAIHDRAQAFRRSVGNVSMDGLSIPQKLAPAPVQKPGGPVADAPPVAEPAEPEPAATQSLALSPETQAALDAPAPAPVKPRTIGEATDEQLALVARNLKIAAARFPNEEVYRTRLGNVEAEIAGRATEKQAGLEAPIEIDDIVGEARVADTPEKQQAILAKVDRVNVPITSFEDLIGDRTAGLRKEIMAAFPQAPKLTPEQVGADIALKGAQAAHEQAQADRRTALTPAEKTRLEKQAARYDSLNALSKAKTDEINALVKPKADKLVAEAQKLKAAADKLKADIAAMRAKGGRGGTGATDLLKQLKMVQDMEIATAKEAEDAINEMQRPLAVAEQSIRDHVEKLEDIGLPGERPTAPQPSRDPVANANLQNSYQRELDDWSKRYGAYKNAEDRLKTLQAEVTTARGKLEGAAKKSKDDRDAAKAVLEPLKTAIRGRAEKVFGAKLPAPTPGAVVPAAPAPVTPRKVQL